jgi:hypothetical protein
LRTRRGGDRVICHGWRSEGQLGSFSIPSTESTKSGSRSLPTSPARFELFLHIGIFQIADRGHSIGNHTKTHPQFRFWRLDPRRLRNEIDRFEETMSRLGFPIPCLFRAPTGMKNPFLHPILSARRLLLVGWSARAYDTRAKEAATAAERLLRTVEPGAILLLHECSQVSIQILEILLHDLNRRKIQCVIPRPEQLRTKRADSKVKDLDCESTCATFSRWGSITQSWRRLYRKDLK